MDSYYKISYILVNQLEADKETAGGDRAINEPIEKNDYICLKQYLLLYEKCYDTL